MYVFPTYRERRYIFQWSGVKRVEAISSGQWEAEPKSCLVMIGVDKSELDAILETLAKSVDPPKDVSMNMSCEEYVEILATKISADGRFKVFLSSTISFIKYMSLSPLDNLPFLYEYQF